MIVNFKEFHTKSNYLSLLRLFLSIPALIFIMKIPEQDNYRYYTFALCVFAMITDILDGYLARKFNEITEWGKIIDPLADKGMMLTIVISLYIIGEIPFHFLLIIALRDIIIFVGGLFVTRIIKQVLPSNLLGKLTVLSIGLFILSILLNLESISLFVYNTLYYLSIGMSFVSIIGYAIRGYESIKWYKNENV